MRFREWNIRIEYEILAANVVGMMLTSQSQATFTIEKLLLDKHKKRVISIMLDALARGDETLMVYIEELV